MSTTIKEEKETASLLDSTQVVIKEALDKLGYSEEVFELLKEPLRMLTVRIPIKMDDNSTKIFTGYRAQHNDAVGPTKGGIRFHPEVDEEEVKALSMWMSLKCGIGICHMAEEKAASSVIRAKCQSVNWKGLAVVTFGQSAK